MDNVFLFQGTLSAVAAQYGGIEIAVGATVEVVIHGILNEGGGDVAVVLDASGSTRLTQSPTAITPPAQCKDADYTLVSTVTKGHATAFAESATAFGISNALHQIIKLPKGGLVVPSGARFYVLERTANESFDCGIIFEERPGPGS